MLKDFGRRICGRRIHGTRAAERESDGAVLSGKDPGHLGRGGSADGSPCLGRGSVARRLARRTRSPAARRSRLADGRPDLAVRAGGGAGYRERDSLRWSVLKEALWL